MTDAAKTIMIVGATGVFGSRLAEHLSTHGESYRLIVTARSLERANQLAARLNKHAQHDVRAVALNRDEDAARLFATCKPWAVVDCTGPFQGADYSLARQAIMAGAHVIDLADAADYLQGYTVALDDLAREHRVSALAGASSTPALSGAAIGHLTAGWQSVKDIEIAITPGGRSEVGQAVIKAVLSYAGKPVTIWKRGSEGRGTGWRDGHRVSMPGLGPRRVALAETADAVLWGQRCWVEGDVKFYAGLESILEQYGLEAMAWLRSRKLIGNPVILAPLLQQARRLTRLFTSDCGGMVVSVTGRDRLGHQRHARWSLVAKQDYGPYVPVMAAVAALTRLRDNSPKPGARLASDVLTLPAIEAPMAAYAITTMIERDVVLADVA